MNIPPKKSARLKKGGSEPQQAAEKLKNVLSLPPQQEKRLFQHPAGDERSKGNEKDRRESSTDARHNQETGQPELVAESAGHRRHGRGARRARHRLRCRRTPPAEHRHHPRRRLGFADMGAFGSEIKTPSLDSLANDGVRFTSFYTHASCSPTRPCC